ncbi:hypothetical protein [Streptomyces sp. MS2.AVA.5]|uniref:Uncharacterized protein n=1 Tax=Streptomyces achmelvichensis TaxID=3134111 RepID=A0ACC6PMA8_9ACTN
MNISRRVITAASVLLTLAGAGIAGSTSASADILPPDVMTAKCQNSGGSLSGDSLSVGSCMPKTGAGVEAYPAPPTPAGKTDATWKAEWNGAINTAYFLSRYSVTGHLPDEPFAIGEIANSGADVLTKGRFPRTDDGWYMVKDASPKIAYYAQSEYADAKLIGEYYDINASTTGERQPVDHWQRLYVDFKTGDISYTPEKYESYPLGHVTWQ